MSSILIVFYITFSCLLSVILIFLSYLCVEKGPYESKISSYECGFAAIKQPTNPFSIRFFVVGVIFLIFDLEIIYLIPWSCNAGFINMNTLLVIGFFFLFVVLGLVYEWIMGGLEWL